MATRPAFAYAVTGVIVAGSIVSAVAATVGLQAERASDAPTPSALQSALVTNATAALAAPVEAVPVIDAAPPAPEPAVLSAGAAAVVVEAPAAAATPTTTPAAQPFATATATPRIEATRTVVRRTRDDDREDDHEHERREDPQRSLATASRRERR